MHHALRRFVRLVLLLLAPATALEPASAEPEVSAGGRFLATSGEVSYLGDLWADLAWLDTPQGSAHLVIDTRTEIASAQSFTFAVPALQYDLALDWRSAPTGPVRWGVALGQRGKERVDERGQPWVRYVAFELNGRGVRPLWRVAAGPVLDDREVGADAVLQGSLSLPLLPGSARSSFFVDIVAEGLWDDGRWHADVEAGPRWVLPLEHGVEAALFVHWLRARNPLGLGEDMWLGGFEYARTGARTGTTRDAPGVDGRIAAGAGEGRLAGTLDLRFLSPTFAGRFRAGAGVEANVRTDEDTDDLWYRYEFGIERVLGRSAAGIWFHHRSNHVLAEPNDRVTSINVLEAGLSTEGWNRPGLRPPQKDWGTLDALARVGYLVDSSFGDDERWHVRGGLRYTAPRPARLQPYMRVEGEAGDVERQHAALGVALPAGVDIEVEYRNDDQYFAADRDGWLLLAVVGF